MAKEAEERRCRICLDVGRFLSPLATLPCRCRGNLALVHPGCLAHWKVRNENNKRLNTCEICLARCDFSLQSTGAYLLFHATVFAIRARGMPWLLLQAIIACWSRRQQQWARLVFPAIAILAFAFYLLLDIQQSALHISLREDVFDVVTGYPFLRCVKLFGIGYILSMFVVAFTLPEATEALIVMTWRLFQALMLCSGVLRVAAVALDYDEAVLKGENAATLMLGMSNTLYAFCVGVCVQAIPYVVRECILSLLKERNEAEQGVGNRFPQHNQGSQT